MKSTVDCSILISKQTNFSKPIRSSDLEIVKMFKKYLPRRTFSVGILSLTAFVGNLLLEILFQDATNAHNPQDHVVILPVSQSFPV